MNELKPSECTVCLPWGFSETSDNARKKHCTACAGTGKVYAVPDTHRVVSVELLSEIVDVCDTACWPDFSEELRAIIDNNGETK